VSQSDKRKFITDVLFIAVILALGYIVLEYLAVWLMPFIVGLVLAIVLQRPVDWVLHHSKLERCVVAPLVTLVIIAVAMTLFVLLFISVVGEATVFLGYLPVWVSKVVPVIINDLTRHFEGIIGALPKEWQSQFREIIYDGLKIMQSRAGTLSGNMLSWVASLAAHLPSLLISFIITLISTFYLCSGLERVKSFFWRQVPAKYKDLAGDTWLTFAHALGEMLRSYLFIMFITFCQLAAGLSLLRLPYSIMLAALISLVDILPVLGTGTILIPWGLFSILTGSVKQGTGILLLYAVITIVRNILEPRIIGKRIELHPLVTLIMMYLGLRVLGVVGVFLFPLIFILLKHAQETGMIRLWK
jgi:sporulation integral membrane protein YtvI